MDGLGGALHLLLANLASDQLSQDHRVQALVLGGWDPDFIAQLFQP